MLRTEYLKRWFVLQSKVFLIEPELLPFPTTVYEGTSSMVWSALWLEACEFLNESKKIVAETYNLPSPTTAYGESFRLEGLKMCTIGEER